MLLNTFPFVSILVFTVPAILCAPHVPDQTSNAVSFDDGFFKAAGYVGAPSNLLAPQGSDQTSNAVSSEDGSFKAAEYHGAPSNPLTLTNNIIALQGDGFQNSYTTDSNSAGDSGGSTLQEPFESVNLGVPATNAPLLAQAQTIPMTPSEHAAELRANERANLVTEVHDDSACPFNTAWACCNFRKNDGVGLPEVVVLRCLWLRGRVGLPCKHLGCCGSNTDSLPDAYCPNTAPILHRVIEKFQHNDVPGFGGGPD